MTSADQLTALQASLAAYGLAVRAEATQAATDASAAVYGPQIVALNAQVASLQAQIAKLTAPPTPSTPAPVWGASYPAATAKLALDDSLYVGRAKAARVYYKGLAGEKFTETDRVARALSQGVRTFIGSWKEEDPAQVEAFAKTVPATFNGDKLTVYAVAHHEPENDAPGAVGSAEYVAWANGWKDRTAALGAIARKYGMIPTTVLMGWSLDPRSGRKLSDWTPAPGAVDVFGFDSYLNDADPTTTVSRIVAACKAAGITRTVLAETGVLSTDSDRGGRIAALRKAILGQTDVHFEVVTYWNSYTADKDFRLDKATADGFFGA